VKKIDRALPPSEAAEAKAKLLASQKSVSAKIEALMKEDFGRTFQTDHGKRVLSWLAKRAGWGRPPLAAGPDGKINQEFTVHNAMELSIYLEIRKHIPIAVLQEVEYGFIQPSGTLPEDNQ